MSESQVTIAHISDLHFSEGTDKSHEDHSHSIEHLVGLQAKIDSLCPDYLIASGDISNLGDKQSLINASGYLLNKIPIGNGEYTGLKFPAERLGVVPGNHDAWNNCTATKLVDRRQQSLENFNFAFPNHAIPASTGCYYDWLEIEGNGIFVAYVDSCFLGDTEIHADSPFGTIRLDQAVAKGKLSVRQTEQLLEWHDLGVKGTLLTPRDPANFIDKSSFSQSLKVLVMHHYLFEPPERASDYFMRISHRDTVFRNIAFSDFDILLCGHKHIPAFNVHAYGDHFDHRATNRYSINCFRRLIGLHSLPVQIEDDNGNRWTKVLTFLANVLTKMVRKEDSTKTPEDIAESVIELLKEGLTDPDPLESKVKKFLKEHRQSGAHALSSSEIKEIKKRLSIGLTLQERKKLRYVAAKISAETKRIKSRPFIQVMAGSVAKTCCGGDRPRSFNMLRISNRENGWSIVCERFIWDWESREFSDEPFTQRHEFVRAT